MTWWDQWPPVANGEPIPPASIERVDTRVQVTPPEVDVLFVIDGQLLHGSRAEAARRQLPPPSWTSSSTAAWDFHIGVTSTDDTLSGLRGRLNAFGESVWIDQDTPEPHRVFEAMARLGTSGSGDEMGLSTTFQALSTHTAGYNAGFLREEAALSVIVISDENDQSDHINPSELAHWMLELKEDPEDVSFSSIVKPPGQCPKAYSDGVRYHQVSHIVGGLVWPICEEDWGLVLTELGQEAARLVEHFPLSEVPLVGTVEVSVEEAGGVTRQFSEDPAGELPDSFVYDPVRNAVWFTDYVPPGQAVVRIRYVVSGA